MENINCKVEDVEKKLLLARIEELEKKVYLLETNAEKKKITYQNFFNDIIKIEKGKRINTASLLRKANEYAEKYDIKFTKFEFADLMLFKGIERKKIGGTNYYCDITIE